MSSEGRKRGVLGALLGIDERRPSPLPPAEVALGDGDVVELADGLPRSVGVLASLEGGVRVCALYDGVEEVLVALDGTGRWWDFSPADGGEGELVAEAYHGGRVVSVRQAGTTVVVCEGGRRWSADLAGPGRLGATWSGPLGPGGEPGCSL